MTVCEQCGTEFAASRVDARTCGDACRQSSRREREAHGEPPATLRLGGVILPVQAFTATAAWRGLIGGCTVVARDRARADYSHASRMPAELRVGDSLLWAGDVDSLERDTDANTVTVEASDFCRRLVRETVIIGNGWNALDPQSFIAQAASAVKLRGACATPLEPGSVAQWLPAAEIPLDRPVSLWAALVLVSRGLGWNISSSNTGELRMEPFPQREPRRLEARKVRVRSHERGCAGFAVEVTSIVHSAYAATETAIVQEPAEIPPGAVTYRYRAPGLRPHAASREAARIRAEIAASWATITGECSDFAADLAPGMAVTVDAAPGVLQVAAIEHRLEAGALVSRLVAHRIPAPPRLAGALVMPPVPASPLAAAA